MTKEKPKKGHSEGDSEERTLEESVEFSCSEGLTWRMAVKERLWSWGVPIPRIRRDCEFCIGVCYTEERCYKPQDEIVSFCSKSVSQSVLKYLLIHGWFCFLGFSIQKGVYTYVAEWYVMKINGSFCMYYRWFIIETFLILYHRCMYLKESGCFYFYLHRKHLQIKWRPKEIFIP